VVPKREVGGDVDHNREPGMTIQSDRGFWPASAPCVVEDRTTNDEYEWADVGDEQEPVDNPEPPPVVGLHGDRPISAPTIA
jgi:hypothetical protein